MKVFDMETYLPGGRRDSPWGEEIGPPGLDRLPPLEGYGFANYGTIFHEDAGSGEALAREEDSGVGVSVSESADELIKMMDGAGVVAGVLPTGANVWTAEAIHRYPDRLLGLAHLSPYDGMRAVRELERLVREEGFTGLSVAALYDQVPAGDARYYPLYAKCVELGVPVRIYTAMTYANDRPYDLGHPRELDRIAIHFPELKIIAGLGGWPWISDMVGLLRRHPNLYCDTAAHRPKYFAKPGSGWEQFLQYGNTLLQDKVMAGLSWKLLGMPLDAIIQEYLDLPLKDSVKEKWLFGNAARFFNLT